MKLKSPLVMVSAPALVVAAAGSVALYSACKTSSTSTLRDTVADGSQYSSTQLQMSADQQTGDVTVTFPLAGLGLQDGQQVQIAWDVVATTQPVNCSSLARSETVTLQAQGGVAQVHFHADPSSLATSVPVTGGDPDNQAKIDPAALDGFRGSTVVEGCLVVADQGVVASAIVQPDPAPPTVEAQASALRLADGAATGPALPGDGTATPPTSPPTSPGTAPAATPGTAPATPGAAPAATPGTGTGPGASAAAVGAVLSGAAAGPLGAAVGAVAADPEAALPPNIRYAERCAQAIGYVAPYSCLDGQVVPIYKDGALQTSNPDVCDKPTYLPTGSTFCNTYTHVGRLKLFKDKALTQPRTDGNAVFFCRHYKDVSAATVPGETDASGAKYPYFNDAAIVMQNNDTGKTCYFQALGPSLYGRRVPPPTETDADFQATVRPEEKTKGATSSTLFWLPPAGIAHINCVSCHDTSPFMHSPWIDQVHVLDASGKPTAEKIVPSNPQADYVVIGAGFGFEKWDTTYAVTPGDDSCTTCHRLGSMATCRLWARDAYPLHEAGKEPADSVYYEAVFKSRTAKSHPFHHWMPPPPSPAPTDAAGLAAWEKRVGKYQRSAEQYQACCNLTNAKGEKILSYGFINKPSGHVIPADDLRKLSEAGCAVEPVSSVVER